MITLVYLLGGHPYLYEIFAAAEVCRRSGSQLVNFGQFWPKAAKLSIFIFGRACASFLKVKI